MKKFLLILSMMLLGMPTFSEQILVPRNTLVKIKVKSPYDSKQIHREVENEHSSRDTIELQAQLAEDVFVNNILIASKGNSAIMEVENYYKAKTFGRGGYIKINGAKFMDNNNILHRLDVEKEFKGKNDIWLTRVILFNRGKQAKITTSDILNSTLAIPFEFNSSNSTYNSQTTIIPVRKSIQINTTSY